MSKACLSFICSPSPRIATSQSREFYGTNIASFPTHSNLNTTKLVCGYSGLTELLCFTFLDRLGQFISDYYIGG